MGLGTTRGWTLAFGAGEILEWGLWVSEMRKVRWGEGGRRGFRSLVLGDRKLWFLEPNSRKNKRFSNRGLRRVLEMTIISGFGAGWA